MITIIEGTDGVGKTTFAKYLAEHTGADYLHAGPPTTKTWADEYIEPLIGRDNLVVDRWHLGEAVWPGLFGRQSLFSDLAQFRNCCKALNILPQGVQTLLILRPRLDIEAELEKRGETEKQIKASMAAQTRFLVAAGQIPWSCNFRVMNSDELPCWGEER